MIAGADIDGTLTLVPIRINFKPFWWFGLWLAFVPPNKKVIEILKKWKANNDKVVLVSARPEQLNRITQWWLKRHDAPYDKIFLIDSGKRKEERKLEIIKREGVEKFIEDDPKTLKFLNQYCSDVDILSPDRILV